MKLSEAMREGAKETRPKTGNFMSPRKRDGKFECCAVGAAVYEEVSDILAAHFGLNRTQCSLGRTEGDMLVFLHKEERTAPTVPVKRQPRSLDDWDGEQS